MRTGGFDQNQPTPPFPNDDDDDDVLICTNVSRHILSPRRINTGANGALSPRDYTGSHLKQTKQAYATNAAAQPPEWRVVGGGMGCLVQTRHPSNLKQQRQGRAGGSALFLPGPQGELLFQESHCRPVRRCAVISTTPSAQFPVIAKGECQPVKLSRSEEFDLAARVLHYQPSQPLPFHTLSTSTFSHKGCIPQGRLLEVPLGSSRGKNVVLH